MPNIDQAGGERTDAAFWDSQWDARDRRGRFREWLLHGRDYGKNGSVLRLISRMIGHDKLRGARVVEIGGAESRILLDLARWTGADVTAVDYSPVGIRETARMFEESGVKCKLVLADVFDWHERDGTFDIVTHWGVLEHFDDPRPMLRASARLAKPDGLILFSMPNLESATARLWQHFAPSNFSAHVCHSDEDLERACREIGLVLEQRVRTGAILARIAAPERGSLFARLAVNGLHTVLLVAARFLPGLERVTPRALASQRYFVARRQVV